MRRPRRSQEETEEEMTEGDLKELEILFERATGGRWSYDCMVMPDGYALAWLGNFYVDSDAPKKPGEVGRYAKTADDAALIVALHNRWPELRELAIKALRSSEANKQPSSAMGSHAVTPDPTKRNS